MSVRSDQQYCALVRAVEVVGDRWTLLIIRELALGPKRFADLAQTLRGVSRKLLSERLRDLEQEGVVARAQLPSPTAKEGYLLTGEGADLARAMVPLAAWGVRRLGRLSPDEIFRPAWLALAMTSFVDRQMTAGVHEIYEFHVGDEQFYVHVADGDITAYDGVPPSNDLLVTTDERTWADIASGLLTMEDAISSERLRAEGRGPAARNCAALFSREALGLTQ